MDILELTPKEQTRYIEGLGYFDLMGFLRMEWMHPGRVHSTRLLLDSYKPTPSSWVLEVGCGTGASTIFAAANYCCRAVGIDRNLTMIDKAARRAADDPATVGRVAFSFARAACLPFPDASFDLAFSEAALGFCDQKPRTLAEIRRVVKPGGCLGIVDFHYTRRPDATLLREMNRATDGHLEALTGEDWMALFSEAGWGVEDCREMPYGAVPSSAIRNDHDDIFIGRPDIGKLSEDAKSLVRARLQDYEALFNRNREILAFRILRLRNPA